MLVAPATADLMAKMANGLADDLASTVLLATDRPVLIAPAMNPKMWAHAATRRNVETLKSDGIRIMGFHFPIALDTTFIGSLHWAGALRLKIEEIAPTEAPPSFDHSV